MKRRRFLQLAASAATGAVVERSSAWSCSIRRCSLRIAPLSVELAPGKMIDATLLALVGDPVPTRAAVDALSHTIGERIGSYEGFTASARSTPEPDRVIEMLLENPLDTRDGKYQWIIDGRRFVERKPLLLQPGQRYRLRMLNATAWPHPIHLQDHRLELKRIHQIPVSGIFKDTIRLERYSAVEADVVVNGRGFAAL